MNFYKHYIGDYQRDTGHLTLTEHGAYRLMLDAYYATGKPLPSDRKALYRLLRAAGATEKKAIDSVASQFWETAGNGLVNRRAALEIEKAEKQAEVNRQIALAREEKRRRIRSGTAAGPVYEDTGPEKNGNGALGDLLHEPDKVFGVCKVNNTQLVSPAQPVSCTNRGTERHTAAKDGSCDGAVFPRKPNHSHSHNQTHNQTGKECGNPATDEPENAFFPAGNGLFHEAEWPEKGNFCGDDGFSGGSLPVPAGGAGPESGGNPGGNGGPGGDGTALKMVSGASVALARAMREAGVMAAAADPRLMALADQGVAEETVRAACAEAKRARPNERIGAAYVVKIVERWARDARSIEARGARAHGLRCVSAERRQVLDELTGRKTVDGAAHFVDDGVTRLPEEGEGPV